MLDMRSAALPSKSFSIPLRFEVRRVAALVIYDAQCAAVERVDAVGASGQSHGAPLCEAEVQRDILFEPDDRKSRVGGVVAHYALTYVLADYILYQQRIAGIVLFRWFSVCRYMRPMAWSTALSTAAPSRAAPRSSRPVFDARKRGIQLLHGLVQDVAECKAHRSAPTLRRWF